MTLTEQVAAMEAERARLDGEVSDLREENARLRAALTVIADDECRYEDGDNMSPQHYALAALRAKAEGPVADYPGRGPIVHNCDRCGAGMTKAEGGTCFTVCETCWDVVHPPDPPAPLPHPKEHAAVRPGQYNPHATDDECTCPRCGSFRPGYPYVVGDPCLNCRERAAPPAPVPYGHCGRCPRCGAGSIACLTSYCEDDPRLPLRTTCAGCGAPYEVGGQ